MYKFAWVKGSYTFRERERGEREKEKEKDEVKVYCIKTTSFCVLPTFSEVTEAALSFKSKINNKSLKRKSVCSYMCECVCVVCESE